MAFYYKGLLLSGGVNVLGSATSNPIGTIISYMGTRAPSDYLICDGSVYNISKYSQLANFFKEQFGAVNHFGGDGTTTFAVPDLRNLFLRGFHGEADDQLSGEIGIKQDATIIPRYISGFSGEANRPNMACYYDNTTQVSNEVTNIDTKERKPAGLYYIKTTGEAVAVNAEDYKAYTPRVVNAAVLYCIKATTTVSPYDVYSTEERIVGIWDDGKPVYRRYIMDVELPSNINATNTYQQYGKQALNIDTLIDSFCLTAADDNMQQMLPLFGYRASDGSFNLFQYAVHDDALIISNLNKGGASSSWLSVSAIVKMVYTKTTD